MRGEDKISFTSLFNPDTEVKHFRRLWKTSRQGFDVWKMSVAGWHGGVVDSSSL